eukprot:TRINITY_DN52754_c0_g1_i1.p1 TRINITY_DN52754_c0_g1~~TRINITY_DN52754_c0_g1_i1.p1  ORF type:complete len:248 (-),score=53.97 TRINITY_DN52754_c0_g1_i1:44-787(-)
MQTSRKESEPVGVGPLMPVNEQSEANEKEGEDGECVGKLNATQAEGETSAEASMTMLERHLQKICRPCAYFWKKEDSCRLGESCSFCHLCDEPEFKARKKEKIRDLRRQGVRSKREMEGDMAKRKNKKTAKKLAAKTESTVEADVPESLDGIDHMASRWHGLSFNRTDAEAYMQPQEQVHTEMALGSAHVVEGLSWEDWQNVVHARQDMLSRFIGESDEDEDDSSCDDDDELLNGLCLDACSLPKAD